MGLFRKYDEIKYLPFFTSIIPILIIFFKIYNAEEFDETDISLIILSYTFLSILTYKYLKITSSSIISHFVGKEIGGLGDDYFTTTVVSNDKYSDQMEQLVKNTITNILNYKLIAINDIYINNRKYKIWHYSRKFAFNSWYRENILFLELLIETDEEIEYIEESDYIKEFEIIDEFEFDSGLVYSFIFLYVAGSNSIVTLIGL